MAINYYHLQPTGYRGPTPLTVPWRFVPRRFYYMTLHALLLPVPWQTILMMMISMGARDSNRDFRGLSNLYLDSKLLKSADAHQQEFLQRMVLLRFGQRLDAAILHAALADTAGVLCGASEHELFTDEQVPNKNTSRISSDRGCCLASFADTTCWQHLVVYMLECRASACSQHLRASHEQASCSVGSSDCLHALSL